MKALRRCFLFFGLTVAIISPPKDPWRNLAVAAIFVYAACHWREE